MGEFCCGVLSGGMIPCYSESVNINSFFSGKLSSGELIADKVFCSTAMFSGSDKISYEPDTFKLW